jgi:LPS export ABC transporter protein LptC
MLKLKYQASRIFNLLTVIILSSLCVLLNYLTTIDFHRLELPKDKPEFSATGLHGTLYSPQGIMLYQINAESGNQFPDNSRIKLYKLNLTAYSESNGNALETLTSNNGWVDPVTAHGFLGESVVITVFNQDPLQVVTVYTKEVQLDGQKRYANSSAPIFAKQHKNTISGLGFSVDYAQQLLTIYSKVKVIYAP